MLSKIVLFRQWECNPNLIVCFSLGQFLLLYLNIRSILRECEKEVLELVWNWSKIYIFGHFWTNSRPIPARFRSSACCYIKSNNGFWKSVWNWPKLIWKVFWISFPHCVRKVLLYIPLDQFRPIPDLPVQNFEYFWHLESALFPLYFVLVVVSFKRSFRIHC